MKIQWVSKIVRASIAVTAFAAPALAGTTYTFRNVADTSGGQFTSLDAPDINNAGTLVFRATRTDGTQGIYTGADPATNAVAETSSFGGYQSFFRPVINNNGKIVFKANANTFTGSSFVGIFTGDEPSPGSSNTIADNTGPFNSFSNPVVSDSGKAAFFGFLKDGTQGVYTGPNPATDTVADTNGAYNNFPTLIQSGVPAINGSGTVAFSAALKSGVPGIFTGADPASTRLFSSPDPNVIVGAVAINDAGKIAVNVPGGDTGIASIKTGPDSIATFISATDGINFGDFWEESFHLNNAGTIAFAGSVNNDTGIFTGPDPVADRVVFTGEALFGSTLNSVFAPFGLNDKGEIAFAYSLQDGRSGIAVASPGGAAAIPLPSALPATLTFAIPVGLLWALRRRWVQISA